MGFKVSTLFPSRFLKGSDLAGLEVPVTIHKVLMEKAYNRKTNKEEQVLVVYFAGKQKGVIVKKERCSDIAAITGSDDTDGWIGKKLIMFTQKRKMKDGIADVIRFKEDKNADLAKELDQIAVSQS